MKCHIENANKYTRHSFPESLLVFSPLCSGAANENVLEVIGDFVHICDVVNCIKVSQRPKRQNEAQYLHFSILMVHKVKPPNIFSFNSQVKSSFQLFQVSSKSSLASGTHRRQKRCEAPGSAAYFLSAPMLINWAVHTKRALAQSSPAGS